MKIRVTIIVLAIAVTAISLAGCNKKDNTSSSNENTVVLTGDEALINESMSKFLSGELVEGDNYFDAGVRVDIDDKYTNYDIIDSYGSTNAFYYKILNKDDGTYYMFRFQMNSSGKIDSYVKYTLEA